MICESDISEAKQNVSFAVYAKFITHKCKFIKEIKRWYFIRKIRMYKI